MHLRQWFCGGWRKNFSFIYVLLMVSSANAQWRQSDAIVLDTLATGRVDWTAGLVQSTARAAAGGREGNSTALQAAMDTARQQLRETLVQLQLDAERTVGSVIQGIDEKQERLAKIVVNAEAIETRYLPRGAIESTMQVSLFGLLTALLWPEIPGYSAPDVSAAALVHTGIVIDARGLGVQHAVFPQIFDEDGHTLYAPARVHAEMARQRGYMVYATAVDSPQIEPRVGKNPLVIRARRVADRGRVNVIVYQADALQLLGSAGLQVLLAQCRVVIIG